MTEKELIQQLKTLKSVKPSKEWAILCKQEIMETQTPSPLPCRGAQQPYAAISWFTQVSHSLSGILSNAFFGPPLLRRSLAKASFATIACFGLVFSVFGYAQGALPGDLLYPAKKITEKVQLNLAAENEKSNIQIAMTNKKIQELNQVVQANLGKNLAPAIQEVEQSAQETAKTLVKLTESVKVVNILSNTNIAEKGEVGQESTAYVLTDTDTAKVKETLAQIQEIKSVKQEVETHGVIVEMPELDEALAYYYKALIEEEIGTMSSQILTEEQEAVLAEIQELFAQEQYQQAYEHFYLNQ